jgi:hypothetical protein
MKIDAVSLAQFTEFGLLRNYIWVSNPENTKRNPLRPISNSVMIENDISVNIWYL